MASLQHRQLGVGEGEQLHQREGDAQEGWMGLWRAASSPVWQEEKDGSSTWVWPNTFLE